MLAPVATPRLAVALVLALCAVGCKSGEVAHCCDGAVADAPAAARDAEVRDSGAADAPLASPDTASPARDGGTVGPRDGGQRDVEADLGPCGLWSNWTCKSDPVHLCQATCGAGSLPEQLTCANNGGCICGVGLGPCGTFAAGPSDCDACRKAVLAGCCRR